MWNQTNRPNYTAGLQLLQQDYRAAFADVKARQDLPEMQQQRLRIDLAIECRRRRAQERDIMDTQIRADHDADIL